nr:g-type lectin s-receptor-like serine/threonine-protein kinase rks1 [Quercus suber]
MDPETMVMPLILIVLFFPCCTSVDTLTPDQFIKDGQSLISNKNNFALGFFSPGKSSYRYLEGNLVLHDSSNRLLWSTNVSIQGTTSSVAQLQDSGNLVLVQGNNETVIWQSFDHPTDTLLPGVRLGMNRITGLDRFLTSWKSQDDPGTGDYFYKMNPTGSPQVVLYKGSTLYWRTSPWPWPTSSSAAISSSSLKYYSVNNEDEVSYAYFFDDAYIISRLVLHNSGLLQLLMWNDGDLQWKEFWSAPKYRCDNYRHCGAYGKCGPESASFNRFECTCLPGYEPKSPKNWYQRDGSEGCVRKQLGLSMCGNGEGFVKVELLKGPDSVNAVWMNKSMSSSECEQACLRNCSCTAFVSINIDGKGNSCLTWYGELNDISESSYERWDLNVRVDATELATYTRKSNGFLGHKRQRAISIIPLMVTLFLSAMSINLSICFRTVKRKLHNQSLYFTGARDYLGGNELEENSRHPDLLIFDLSCIVAATDNFSPINKLGQGGFGSVFKGQLSNGQQVAVKRLSNNFGIARIFKGDQVQDKTTRVIGTYGYMSPEYVIFGKFSTKSDVFSFGIILLEIISGKKNNNSYQTHPSLTLIGHVWELWTKDRALDIVDSSITESFVSHEEKEKERRRPTTVAARRQGRQQRHGTWWWSTSSATVVDNDDGVGGGQVLIWGLRRLMDQSQRWGSKLPMEAGADVGHRLGSRHWLLCWLGDEKLMWGCGYTRIAGAGLGLFKISCGKNLKGNVIFGWIARLMVLLSSGCLRLCCMDQKFALIPKLT